MKKSYKTKMGFFSVFFLSFLFWGCADSPRDSVPVEDDVYITLNLNMPHTSGTSSTRALTAIQEETISGLQVLVFNESSGTGENAVYAYSAPITKLNAGSVTVLLRKSSDLHRLVFLVNPPASSPLASAGETKGVVLARFAFACSGVWNTDADTYTPLPMWGESNASAVDDATTFKDRNGSSSAITLLRALARVDVGVNFDNDPTSTTASGIDKFKLHSVRVFNSKDKGYAACWGSYSSGSPWLPTGVGNNATNPLVYTLSTSETTANSYCQSIYLPEAPAGAKVGDANATFLVVGGYYGAGNITKETYYRVDFINTSNAMLALLRNHRYRVNITTVSAEGFATVDEAKSSLPFNMKAEVVDWDDSTLGEMAWNGQYYLACGTREVTLNMDKGSTVQVTVLSNLPASEWVITGNSSYYTVTKPADAATSGYLTFTATEVGTDTKYNTPVTYTLTVKNLSVTFTVRQRGRYSSIPVLPTQDDTTTETAASGGKVEV